MALIVNGVTIPSSGVVTYSGVSLDKVICNGVTVFEKVSTPIREPASGEYYNATTPTYGWVFMPTRNGHSIYFGTEIVGLVLSSFDDYLSTFSYNGYTYYKGSLRSSQGSPYPAKRYGIYRIKN